MPGVACPRLTRQPDTPLLRPWYPQPRPWAGPSGMALVSAAPHVVPGSLPGWEAAARPYTSRVGGKLGSCGSWGPKDDGRERPPFWPSPSVASCPALPASLVRRPSPHGTPRQPCLCLFVNWTPSEGRNVLQTSSPRQSLKRPGDE